MFSRCLLCFVFLCLTVILPAAEVMDFAPTHAAMIFRIDLSQPLPGLEDVRNDLLTTASRQSGFDGKNDKSANISKLLQEVLIVTPKLTEDFSFIIVKMKVTEKEFCAELEKMTGQAPTSVKGTKPTEYRLQFADMGVGSLLAKKKRIFAFAFLAENIAVFAKDSLDRFRTFKPLGLIPKDRKILLNPKFISAGFVKMDPEFLMENPLVPPFEYAFCVLTAGPASSLQVKMDFAAADTKAAKQLQKYIQQMVMVGAMLLNQSDEELMMEWMASVKVNRNEELVNVSALFTRSFIDRLARLADNSLREPDPASSVPPAPPKKP